jgi:hypothetical protein
MNLTDKHSPPISFESSIYHIIKIMVLNIRVDSWGSLERFSCYMVGTPFHG